MQEPSYNRPYRAVCEAASADDDAAFATLKSKLENKEKIGWSIGRKATAKAE